METAQWGSGRQRFSFKRGSGEGPWLVVIHGGAWRDPSTTDASGHHLISTVEAARPGKYAGYASLDYRLSPEVVHPEHFNDVLEGFRELAHRFGVTRTVLVGHSCGAFLAGQLAAQLGSKVDKIIALEGIYDLDELVAEYPDYAGFVNDAFPDERPSLHWPDLAPAMLAIHSQEDELLSFGQTEWLTKQRPVELVLLQHGKHDEVFEQLDLGAHF